MNELLNILLEDKDIFKPRDKKEFVKDAMAKIDAIDDDTLSDFIEDALLDTDAKTLNNIAFDIASPQTIF